MFLLIQVNTLHLSLLPRYIANSNTACLSKELFTGQSVPSTPKVKPAENINFHSLTFVQNSKHQQF